MSVQVFRRVWQWIRTPRHCVGRDFDGNSYFEYPNPNDAWGRTKRVVKYREGYDMWTYIAGEKRLPIQWSSWLTHTRPHPPTLEELAADLERQKNIRLRAAFIEARDREEREALRIAASPVSGTPVSEHNTSTTPQSPSVPVAPQGNQLVDNRASGLGSSPIVQTEPAPPSAQPAPKPPLVNDEPQAWTPRAARRG